MPLPTVCATCRAGALATFVSWAPFQPLAEAGAIMACAFLLNTSEFRLTACGILRDIISRKQQQASESHPAPCVISRSTASHAAERSITAPNNSIGCCGWQEPAAVYGSTMAAAGTGLMQTAASLLQAPAELDFEGANDEFGRRLCDTMSLFGQQHLSTFEHRAAFMQQVRMLLAHWHGASRLGLSSTRCLKVPTQCTMLYPALLICRLCCDQS